MSRKFQREKIESIPILSHEKYIETNMLEDLKNANNIYGRMFVIHHYKKLKFVIKSINSSIRRDKGLQLLPLPNLCRH